MTNQTLETKVEPKNESINEAYAPFKEIIRDWQFNEYRANQVYFEKEVMGGKLVGYNPDYEVAIECITAPREGCNWNSFFAGKVNRCKSEVDPKEGSPNKFKVGDKIVSLDLSPEYLSKLKDYARNMGNQMTSIQDRKKVIPSMQGYISLEAIIPFLDENSHFYPSMQPYFHYFAGTPSRYFNYPLADHAMAALKYVIKNRDLLGKNKKEVLNDAVNNMLSLAICGSGGVYTNPKWENTFSPVAVAIARNTLKNLIKEDSSYEWINEEVSRYDNERGVPFKDLGPSSIFDVRGVHFLAPCEGAIA